MKIINRFFPEILSDNEANYFQAIFGIIESVDELSSIEIMKTPSSYNFRLIPSVPKYTNMLIAEILKFHNLLNIQLDMSKSIKTSSTVFFKVELK